MVWCESRVSPEGSRQATDRWHLNGSTALRPTDHRASRREGLEWRGAAAGAGRCSARRSGERGSPPPPGDACVIERAARRSSRPTIPRASVGFTQIRCTDTLSTRRRRSSSDDGANLDDSVGEPVDPRRHQRLLLSRLWDRPGSIRLRDAAKGVLLSVLRHATAAVVAPRGVLIDTRHRRRFRVQDARLAPRQGEGSAIVDSIVLCVPRGAGVSRARRGRLEEARSPRAT
jgi:hypothetical protein